jgi:hypothetical protein
MWSYRNDPSRIDRQNVVTKSKVAVLPKRGCKNVELAGFCANKSTGTPNNNKS